VQSAAELGPLRQSFLAAQSELERFQRQHRLERPARNPSGRWTTVGFLVILVGIESVLNGAIFQKGAQFGWIGGIGTAIGISLVNVVLGYLLGWGPARFIAKI
jgi:hypothetical protein